MFIGTATTATLSATYYVNKNGSVWNELKAATSEIDLTDALAGTVTDKEEILENQNLMRYKMEAFITNLQGKIIKKFQEYEPESIFIVDKWARKEVNSFCKNLI